MSHGGKLVARALKNAGVECIFTLSGGRQLHYLKKNDKISKKSINEGFAREALAHALLPNLLYHGQKYRYTF